jgi:hypothetical protein
MMHLSSHMTTLFLLLVQESRKWTTAQKCTCRSRNTTNKQEKCHFYIITYHFIYGKHFVYYTAIII